MRASAVVALGTLLSRITGLVRVGVLAYALGQATLADRYNLANSTPNIVYELVVGGVLTATLVPVFVDHLQRRDDRATSAVFTVTLAVLAGLTVLAMLAAPAIARLYAIDASGASIEGVTKAGTIGEARAHLLDKNLYPVRIQEKRGGMMSLELTKEKVKKKELMHFTRQLGVFVKAGIPLTEALEIIGDE